MGIFDINKLDIKTIETSAGKIHVMDNFYQNPIEVEKHILSHKCPLRFSEDKSRFGFNGKHYEDRRHLIPSHELKSEVYDRISKFLLNETGRNYKNTDSHQISTNSMQFLTRGFNNFKNYFWWPHIDKPEKMNMIVYFNKSTCGTNLYRNTTGKLPYYKEHFQPWCHKSNWEILYSITPKFNRMVIFDGTVYHGMDINSDVHFDYPRINQIAFFDLI